mmetsp:Transcript_1339/g.1451  ORF Transcript_1339/g.1451 Transcript_1339/m.1451 type:complete len:373 (-) Transcript_1339:29-1147(-)
MSQNIPAWKKIGLKIKEDVQDDPIALTSHIEDVNLTNKQAKKLNKQKRKLEEVKNEDKRAPKRVKLPKSERAPPPEKDQLAYLRQYENDKLNWKFSKQKQNWILKNIKDIPKDYERALQAYLEGLQGGSRKRVVDDLMEVIKKWNKAAEEAEVRVEREIQRQLNGETGNDEDDKNKEEENTERNNKTKRQVSEQEEAVPDYDYAKRCGVLVKILNDEDVELKGIDITDADIRIGKKDEQMEPSIKVAEENTQLEGEEKKENDEEESEKNANTQDNLIIDEVEVAGLSKSDSHLDRTKLNKEKFNDIPKENESHESLSEESTPGQESQIKDEKKEKSKKNEGKTKDLSDGKVKKIKKEKKEKKKEKKTKKSKD